MGLPPYPHWTPLTFSTPPSNAPRPQAGTPYSCTPGKDAEGNDGNTAKVPQSFSSCGQMVDLK